MRRRYSQRREPDIKAPDGFLLGGYRRVRKDATVLFHRGWWRCPEAWIGFEIQVHVADCWGVDVDAAPPDYTVAQATLARCLVRLERTERRDAA